MMENNLPNSWVNVPLNEIAKVEWGNTSITKKSYTKKGYPAYSASGQDGYLNSYEWEGEAIVLSAIGARCGKCFFATDKWTAIKNTIVIQSDPKHINHKLLFYYLNDETKWAISGSGQPFITMGSANKLLIPLPPRKEQQRIVTKLDDLMEKIDRSRARLDRIPKILKRFRQSILSAAISGKLTEDWREKKSLPEWKEKRAEDLCYLITKGTTPRNGALYSIGEIPFLKVYNIVEQTVNFNYKPQYVSNEIHNTYLNRSKVFPGDVIMNIVGPPLGKVAIIPNQFKEWNLNQALAIFRPKGEILSKFIYFILSEGSPVLEIEKEFRGTAGQSNISLAQCRNFIFPVPTIEEQNEIIRRVEQLFTFSDKIETRYLKINAQIDKLPQSLFAKTFCGELVAQDPNDEPASVLLERIKSVKVAQIGKSKSLKKYKIANERLSLEAED